MSFKLKEILSNPALLFISLGHRECLNWISDETYLKIIYRIKRGERLNLENPQTFTEKLNWLKLYNRNPEYTQLVDKYEVKKVVADIIGEEHIVPTLGVWDKFDDIDFDKLPNQFVLKCTHDSGGLIICKDKSKLDIEKARKKINNCLNHSFYWGMREWQYKDVKPRIIAESYLVDKNAKIPGDLNDYKFYCFNGEPKYCEVISGRYSDKRIDFFDLDWKHEEFNFEGYEFAEEQPQKPKPFKEMVEIVGKLCKDKPYSRIDLYVVEDKIFFGEITFFPAAGLKGFIPAEWNYKLGSYISLSESIKK